MIIILNLVGILDSIWSDLIKKNIGDPKSANFLDGIFNFGSLCQDDMNTTEEASDDQYGLSENILDELMDRSDIVKVSIGSEEHWS